MYEPGLLIGFPLAVVDQPTKSYPDYLSVISVPAGSFKAVPPAT